MCQTRTTLWAIMTLTNRASTLLASKPLCCFRERKKLWRAKARLAAFEARATEKPALKDHSRCDRDLGGILDGDFQYRMTLHCCGRVHATRGKCLLAMVSTRLLSVRRRGQTRLVNCLHCTFIFKQIQMLLKTTFFFLSSYSISYAQ